MKQLYDPHVYFVIVALFIISCAGISNSAFAETAVVSNTQLASPLNRNTLRAIFGMRLNTWPNQEPIIVFVLPNEHPQHISFCKSVLETFPHQLQRSWDRLVYTGTGQSPIEVKSELEMLQRVKTTPGAIGYVQKESVNDDIPQVIVQ